MKLAKSGDLNGILKCSTHQEECFFVVRSLVNADCAHSNANIDVFMERVKTCKNDDEWLDAYSSHITSTRQEYLATAAFNALLICAKRNIDVELSDEGLSSRASDNKGLSFKTAAWQVVRALVLNLNPIEALGEIIALDGEGLLLSVYLPAMINKVQLLVKDH